MNFLIQLFFDKILTSNVKEYNHNFHFLKQCFIDSRFIVKSILSNMIAQRQFHIFQFHYLPKLCEHCGIQSRNLHPTNYGCCYIWFLAHTRVKISWRYLWRLHKTFFLCFRAESWNFEINVLLRFCIILQLPSYLCLRKIQKSGILISIYQAKHFIYHLFLISNNNNTYASNCPQY